MKYGCSSPSILYKKQKCVEGISLVAGNPPLFCCPFCEKAKQTKNHGGPRSLKEIIIPSQMFHMNISFVSGPSNLKQMLENGVKPNKIIKKSREGYIGFLTIIDAAFQYIWAQPIKNKYPLVEYVDHFLKKNGLQKTDSAVIMTSPDGYLAK